ncbi:MAG: site-2 protease family protein [Firmicutes bacterium]|jgi:Zn-dependent protease|nr:site-2 protease family protein [Bacillota bacterium]
MTDLREIVLTIPVFLLAISFHEYAHALTAVRLGDPTPRYRGRLTLNFHAHFSWLGALMLIIAGIGWAKPVEINTRNLRNPKTDMLWISLAGPTANLVLAVAFAMLVRLAIPWVTPASIVGRSVVTMLYLGVRLNVLLAAFNLIPIPPLDGAKVANALLPSHWGRALESMEPWGFVIIFVLLRFFGLDRLLYTVAATGSRILL